MGHIRTSWFIYIYLHCFFAEIFLFLQKLIKNIYISVFPERTHILLPAAEQQPVAKELREKRSILTPSVLLAPFYKMEARNTVSHKHEILARKYLSSEVHSVR